MKPHKLFMGLIILAILTAILSSGLTIKINPGEIGVRANAWGSGVETTDFEPGLHLGVIGVHKWHRLDRRSHFLTFSSTDSHRSGRGMFVVGAENSQRRPPLDIRTKDNNTAAIDVTVTYHIIEGEANLLVAEGLQTSYRDRVVSTVQSVLREELAQLSPEDFVQTETRLQRATDTMPVLIEALRKFHIMPDRLMIRAVRFPETYERKLQDRQLKQQLALLEESLQKVEEALAKTGKIEKLTEAEVKKLVATWDKQLQESSSNNKVKVAQVLGESNEYDLRVRATVDAEYEVLVADGNLAVTKADALRDKLKNEALDTVGGRILQARDAAENLIFQSITLNSNNPDVPSVIDIDALVRLLVGTGGE
jgi:regulator of protease activity HflC (stomatin/prohibitin superfamily)